MTIKTRNSVILFITFFSFFLILGAGLLTGLSAASHNFAYPDFARIFTQSKFMQDYFFTKFEFLSIIISIFLFPLYVFISLLYINIEFEKTQSDEIIYFSMFLIGCGFEVVRILFPIMDLWQQPSSVSILISRIVIFARSLAPLGLLFASVYSSAEYRQYSEQNVLIIFIGSLCLAMFAPLNTAEILPLCRIKIGYELMFKTVQSIILGIAVAAHIAKAVAAKTKASLPIAVLCITAGYFILCNVYNYLFLAIAGSAMIAGSFIYLKALHNKYLWSV